MYKLHNEELAVEIGPGPYELQGTQQNRNDPKATSPNQSPVATQPGNNPFSNSIRQSVSRSLPLNSGCEMQS
ncbi:hypothetical protein [Bradyrhizobium sp. USDA 4486]